MRKLLLLFSAVLPAVFCQQKECVCVDYWLCANGRIITDGSDLLDIRTKTCPGIEVCCLLDDGDNTHTNPPPDSTTNHPLIVKPTTHTPPVNTGDLQIPTVAPGGGCGRTRFPPDLPTGFKVTGIDGRAPEPTFYGEAPWMVVILIQDEKSLTFKCGGTLITPSIVLTSAHCLEGIQLKKFVIKAGEYDNRITKKPIPSQTKGASRVVIHPKYNNGNLHNDIGLIFLDSKMQLNEIVDVICPMDVGTEVNPSGCVVTGWGRNSSDGYYQSVLSKVSLELRDRDYCVNLLRTSRLGKWFKLHEGFICAGGGDNRDTCNGDGGGPLYCPSKHDVNQMIQVGVVSWGIGCGDGFPTVLTSVPHYLPWIQSQIS